MRVRQQTQPRRAAYVVEAAMVISMVVLFLFGIFEYGRYIFCMQVTENAAREGARMAIAHTHDKTADEIMQRVRQKLAGVDRMMTGVDIKLTGIIMRPKDPSEVPGTPLSDWTQAAPTDGIAIEISGSYRPILPTLILMPATIPISVRTVMYSEGN